jgi:hypothetical protein
MVPSNFGLTYNLGSELDPASNYRKFRTRLLLKGIDHALYNLRVAERGRPELSFQHLPNFAVDEDTSYLIETSTQGYGQSKSYGR